MRAILLLVSAVLIAGCRPDRESPSSKASPAVHVDAARAAEAGDASLPPAGTVDSGSRQGSAPAPSLPPKARLLAPFRGKTARGFVAITAGGPSQSARLVASLAGGAADPDRPVLVASFTKLWTAVAALRMVERGELSLDETVGSALPELASRPWADSTLRELLTHTSRVPELDDKGGFYRRRDVDFSSPVEALARYVPRGWTEKRGVYKYRNAEAALAGAILAARAGQPAERVLAREVFEPARMTRSGILVGSRPPPEGLDLAPMGPIRPQNFFTAGAGWASAADLLAFFEALSGGELLAVASKRLLFDGAPERGHAALGCWAYPFARPEGGTTQLVERPGSFGNVRLFAAYFPDERRAVVAWTSDGVEIGRPRARGIGASLARAALE